VKLSQIRLYKVELETRPKPIPNSPSSPNHAPVKERLVRRQPRTLMKQAEAGYVYENRRRRRGPSVPIAKRVAKC